MTKKKQCIGYTIDSPHAQVLDDGFRVLKQKDGSYHLHYFITDTAAYYHQRDEKPDSDQKKDHFHKPNISIYDKREILSLKQDDLYRAAIRVHITINNDGFVDWDKTHVEHVSFKNTKKLTKKNVAYLYKQGDTDACLWYELATTLQNQQNKTRLNRSSARNTPGDVIPESFSNTANAALTYFARKNNIPIIYQNRSALIPALNERISTRDDAYSALDILYPSEDDIIKLEASCHGKMDEGHDHSTTSTGNIDQGYEHFARFTSPMQCLMETMNLYHIEHFISNQDTAPMPFSKADLEKTIEITTSSSTHNRLRQNFNKRNSLEEYLLQKIKNNNIHFFTSEIKHGEMTKFLEMIFENPDRLNGTNVSNFIQACTQRIKENHYNPDYLLEKTLISNPRETKEQKTLAKLSLDIAIKNNLSENIIRLSVERSGTYEAIFIEKKTVGSQTIYKPILVKNGELLSLPVVTPTMTAMLKHENEIENCFDGLLTAIVEDNLCPAHQTEITWSKKSLRIMNNAKANKTYEAI